MALKALFGEISCDSIWETGFKSTVRNFRRVASGQSHIRKFAPNIDDDGVTVEGKGGQTIDEYIAWATTKLSAIGGTMHHIGNHLVELHGDHAISEAYSMSTHWGGPEDIGMINFTSGARFIDHMERRDGRWAIKERWAVREWTRSDEGRFVNPEGPGPRGRRDASDPLTALRRSLE